MKQRLHNVSPSTWETAIAAVQGAGALILAWFTATAPAPPGAELTFGPLWSTMLAIGGVAAVGLATIIPRTETLWVGTGTLLATAMIGRGLDIVWRIDVYTGRPHLAVAVWTVMGISTITTWVVVGGITHALDAQR